MMNMLAELLFKSADGHRKATEILDERFKEIAIPSDSLILPLYNMLGLSLELYMKSYLSTLGYESKVLSRSPFGHNLVNIWNAAKEKGMWQDVYTFHIDKSAVDKIVNDLNKNYFSQEYRYIKNKETEIAYFLDVGPAIEVLHAMHLRNQSILYPGSEVM